MPSPTISFYDSNPSFIGNPVVFQATPTGGGTNASFYRLKVHLVAALTNGDNVDFDFSIPIGTKLVNNVLTAQNVHFDISSALRAVAELWRPEAIPPNAYPTVNYHILAQEEWMVDGATYNSDTTRYPTSGSANMFMGTLTDRERIVGATEFPSRYSRKPSSSPEICFHDLQVIVPGPTSAAPAVTLYLAGDPGEQTFENLNYHIITPPPVGHEIRFINSLGVHENVFVFGLPSKNTHITTEQYVIARQETMAEFSRGLALKKNDYETWTLTTGALDKEWASWYIHEFLMARWLWINVNGQYIPCHVLPDDTTLLDDSITPSRHEVIFKIQFDINGSPL